MNVRDVLYFSPKYKFSDLKWGNKTSLIIAFRNRVDGFYLEPAKQLNKDKSGFATGVLCITTVDFLARISIGTDRVRERITDWLKTNIVGFRGNLNSPKQTLANRFYDEFRNGLVHEGRIKNAGQFPMVTKN